MMSGFLNKDIPHHYNRQLAEAFSTTVKCSDHKQRHHNNAIIQYKMHIIFTKYALIRYKIILKYSSESAATLFC